MTIHDQAHALARSIKESDEYRQYAAARDSAAQNPELAAMINDIYSILGEVIKTDAQ
jgi:cell fate (sporulation/competence/biofilm development) regulator YlbF (YheA/YmcA/DUF963 family)